MQKLAEMLLKPGVVDKLLEAKSREDLLAIDSELDK